VLRLIIELRDFERMTELNVDCMVIKTISDGITIKECESTTDDPLTKDGFYISK